MKEKICVFGTGRYYQTKKEELETEYEIVSFIDNRILPGQTDQMDQVTVSRPSDWIKSAGKMRVMMMSADWMSMWEQLVAMGVEDDRILFALDMKPYYDTTEELVGERGIDVSSKDRRVVFREGEKESYVTSEAELKTYFRKLYHQKYPYIQLISEMPMKPSSRRFGFERGMAVDRIYIERFLRENKSCIHGTVIEIGDDRYMSAYRDQIDNPVTMHVNGWGGMKGNLATGEGIVDDFADCLICTQTLQHIFDIQACVKNIYRLLKPGGTALITNGCIAELSLYDYHNWGEFWKFTDMTACKLFQESFGPEKIKVDTFGNMKVAIAMLYGLCAEDLPEDVFAYQDEQYPMIVAVKATK